jgi:hypothetical protein
VQLNCGIVKAKGDHRQTDVAHSCHLFSLDLSDHSNNSPYIRFGHQAERSCKQNCTRCNVTQHTGFSKNLFTLSVSHGFTVLEEIKFNFSSLQHNPPKNDLPYSSHVPNFTLTGRTTDVDSRTQIQQRPTICRFSLNSQRHYAKFHPKQSINKGRSRNSSTRLRNAQLPWASCLVDQPFVNTSNSTAEGFVADTTSQTDTWRALFYFVKKAPNATKGG